MLEPGYVSGLADGEGCFCVSISPRKLKEVQWEIRPSFSISLNKKSKGILYQIRDFFQCGFIRPSKKDNTYKYEIRELKELAEKIIPHFQKYHLYTEKKKDFETFEKVVRMMRQGKHLSFDGLKEIVSLIVNMNPHGKKIYNRKEIADLMNV